MDKRDLTNKPAPFCRTTRRSVLTLAMALAASTSVRAQKSWPTRPVTILVPLGAGGANDIIARMLAEHFSARFGGTFIVENRVGAAGAIAMTALAKAEPDGHTLGIISTATHAANPALRSKLPYDPARDLASIALLIDNPYLLVTRKDFPAQTLAEFREKAAGGSLSFGSPGTGSGTHLINEMFNGALGIRARHVPFRSGPENVSAILGGHVDYSVEAVANVASQLASGNMRAYVATSTERLNDFPDLPSVAEIVPGFQASAWGGLAAPAGTPPELREVLATETRKFLEAPATLAKLKSLHILPAWKTGSDLDAFLASERKKWGDVVAANGLKQD